MKHLRALQSLRLNYTRRGCWHWLRGRRCGGRYHGERGWRILLRDPERVEQEQHAIADGAFL